MEKQRYWYTFDFRDIPSLAGTAIMGWCFGYTEREATEAARREAGRGRWAPAYRALSLRQAQELQSGRVYLRAE
tara:strand:+ start:595 stop:816 length:222 start_codon:yes stop_codon:yes gene_type:complete